MGQDEGNAPGGTLLPRLVLAAYVVVLGMLLRGQVVPVPSLPPLGDLADRHFWPAAAQRLATAIGWAAARFVPIGFTALYSLPAQSGWLKRQIAVTVPSWILAVAAAGSVRVIQAAPPVAWPSPFDLVLPMVGCWIGLWAAAAWRRGFWSRVLFLPKLALTAGLLALLLVAAAVAATERVPLPFPETIVQSGEKRRLHNLVRGKDPRAVPESETRELKFTQRDMDVLMAWGFTLTPGRQKAMVELHPGRLRLLASAGIPLMGGSHGFLNLTTEAAAQVTDGRLDLQLAQFRLGHLEAPAWLLGLASPALSAALNVDARTRPALTSLRKLEATEGGLSMIYSRANLPSGFLAELFHDEAPGERAALAQIYVQHMLAGVAELPAGDARFGACLRRAFALAAERSQRGSPALENTGAIAALGVLMGTPSLALVVGVTLNPADHRPARQLYKTARVRNRIDWVQHFLVSATLTALSIEAVSDAAGLAKEELDADGGSGFSFGDLLADRAGTTFGATATRDDASARRMQERLARGFDVDDFFPPAADLPEDMTEAQFRARYGGVGGEGYLRLREEIERRVAACAAYRNER